MRQFFPNATYIENGKEQHISTYDSTPKLSQAKDQLRVWISQYGFDLKECWIDCYIGGRKTETLHINKEEL